MLVLARRINESFVIQTPQGEVLVKFLGYTLDGEVRLGFAAPREIEIKRAELVEGKDERQS